MSDDIETLKASVVDRLHGSFSNLERAISGAKERLSTNPQVDPQVVERIMQYETVLTKQRSIAAELAENFAKGDFKEVARQVNIINNLSSMIIDDAKQIIIGLQESSGFDTGEAENDDVEWKNNLC